MYTYVYLEVISTLPNWLVTILYVAYHVMISFALLASPHGLLASTVIEFSVATAVKVR